MAFTKSETNPNAAVGGGCIGIGGVRGYDCVAPFYTAEGVVGMNSTCPKIVVCEYHRGELNRAAAGEGIPVGYGTVEAAEARDWMEDAAEKPTPKPRAKRKPKQDGELSL